MDVRETALPGVRLLLPRIFADDRGLFVEAYNERTFSAAGLPTYFVQDNHSRSRKGVIRGLHYQLKQPQGKLVRCVRGSIFDVAVDIRRGSPSFGKWASVTLDETSLAMLWIPPGFAHGFCATSETADVVYKCTDFYAAGAERGIAWNDPDLGIPWPVGKPVVSAKDAAYPTLSKAMHELPEYQDTSR